MYIQIRNNIPTVKFMLMGDDTFILTNECTQNSTNMTCTALWNVWNMSKNMLIIITCIHYKHTYITVHIHHGPRTWADEYLIVLQTPWCVWTAKTILLTKFSSFNINTHFWYIFAHESMKEIRTQTMYTEKKTMLE